MDATYRQIWRDERFEVFRRVLLPLLALLVAGTAGAATFGRVVPLRGHAADLAVDEARRVVYVANFTANRIEVIGMATGALQNAIAVAPQPGAVALSPDGQYLVVAHFGQWQEPSSGKNSLTILDLRNSFRQTLALETPPLAVAFGYTGRALVVSTNGFFVLQPANGTLEFLASLQAVAAELPVEIPTYPSEVKQAAVGVSADGRVIYGVASLALASTDASSDSNLIFRYDVEHNALRAAGVTASPALGPRVVSVNRNGSAYLAGWALFDWRGALLAQFPNASGQYEFGGHAFDSDRGVIYAQVQPAESSGDTSASFPWFGTDQTPRLLIVSDDNLTVRETLRLPENLAGKALLDGAGENLYALSESGLLILPVGRLNQVPRIAASREDLLFRNDFCNRQVGWQEVEIRDLAGGNIDFALSTSSPGVFIETPYGVTPARVRIAADPNAFLNQQGTTAVEIRLESSAAVNEPVPLRVLVNNRNPDQRGTIFNVPGRLVDIVADPMRDRFYVLRQSTNEVLVFDGSNYNQIAAFRTGNTPTSLAITYDRRYVLVGHDNSGVASVYNLDRMGAEAPVVFPLGHYPRQIAASSRAILAATRNAGERHTIDRIDLAWRTAVELPSLGIFQNDVHMDTVLSASASGGSIYAAGADGTVMLFDTLADTFVVARHVDEELGGGFAALGDEYFAVGDRILNASLTPLQSFGGEGSAAGYGATQTYGLRAAVTDPSAPGILARFAVGQAGLITPTRTAEAPLPPVAGFAFRRSVAPLANGKAIVVLTTSGFTVLSWDYDAAVADPRISGVVNAADFSPAAAPGGLISVFGTGLSPVTAANSEVPVPTALGGTCLTVNGMPIPMFYVSPGQVNAQLPFHVTGNATLVLRTPGGASNPYNLALQSTAPSVFHSGTVGPQNNVPTVIRDTNKLLVTNSNPIHIDDYIVIYATGMGLTTVPLEAGQPAPADPLALALVPPQVTLGGFALPVTFAGLSPGLVGVYQINAQVPFGAPRGFDVPLTISQGGYSTTLPVRVVK